MKRVDDFRLRFGKQELVPIIIGGMGVDISTAELALEVARLGGIGHISDAMVPDRVRPPLQHQIRQARSSSSTSHNVASSDKSAVQFDLGCSKKPRAMHVRRTMEAKHGAGLIFINCMEKLTMNAPRETLRVRLNAALDAGIDGITLSAGLHLGSFALIEDHPRFRDAKLGIIVSSSARAAAVPAQERPPATPARLRRGGRPARRRPPRLRHGLGEVRPAPPSSPRCWPA